MVMIKGERYCLTQLGFGLNVALMIMKVIVSTAVAQEEWMMKATSSYIDDIYVNVEVISVDEVKVKSESFGLTYKDPQCLKHGAKVLGLKILGGVRHLMLEVRTTHRIFHVWEVGRPLPHLQLATHDSRSPKKTCDCGDQGMG